MDTRIKDITGKRFGKLLVIGYSHSAKGQTFWKVKCDCGKEKISWKQNLIQGTSISCGCYNKKRASSWLKSYANGDKHKNEGNPMWKGDNVGYFALHDWVKRRLKKPKNCEFCKKEKILDLASKSRKYKRDLDDWLWLCRKCHIQYDKSPKSTKKE